MKVTWYGHACFRLEANGISLITDPYTPERAGLEPVTDSSDFVVMSSALDDAHAYWQMIPGEPRVVNALDVIDSPVTLSPGIELSAIGASEGSDRPDDPKANAIYLIKLDGLRICHMGDVGTPLSDEHLEFLSGGVDILLALAGANLTIALPDLDTAIDAIEPRVVIPMHYWTPSIHYTLARVEEFLERRGEEIVRRDASSAEFTADTLPERRTIVTLRPALDPVAV
jgi:L-ascorbate metabolism protein UlaG (beta-lactamase superfamily)